MTDLPLVRLDPNQTKLWYLNQGGRMLIARVFSKRYGTCIVLTDTCYAVAKVDERARIELAKPPYQRFEMWQIANKPTIPECHCRDFIDPEIGGPWGSVARTRHHPMCIFDRPSAAVFGHFARLNQAPIEDIKRALEKQRPDAWNRQRAELEGSAVSTLGVR